jgi:type IX secretion system PorP/SprF family membrane protein
LENLIEHIVNFKKIRYIAVLLLIMMIHQHGFSQQNAQFTQYVSNELLINPAFAGAEEALSISLLHKAQWSGVEGAPTTQSLTAHSLFKSSKVGIGLAIVNDKIGIHNILTASTSFAYRIQLKKETFLSFGLQFGVNQKKSDYSSLSGQIQNPDDPKLNSSNLSETGFEFGSGIYLITPRLNVGISMPNMLYKNIESDSIENSLLNNNIYFLLRYGLPLSSNFVIQPGFLIKYTYGLPLSMDVNIATVVNNVLLIGVSYRIEESINPIIQAKITPQFKIGYAFDYPLSKVSSYGSNSHEFMISYLFSFSKQKVTKLR